LSLPVAPSRSFPSSIALHNLRQGPSFDCHVYCAIPAKHSEKLFKDPAAFFVSRGSDEIYRCVLGDARSCPRLFPFLRYAGCFRASQRGVTSDGKND
jgi:hypothetical protein